MMSFRAAPIILLAALPASSAQADPPRPVEGLYEVTFRLELPHLERWAIEERKAICVSEALPAGRIPFPPLSDNNPFSACHARNIRQDGEQLTYDIACDGRDAAKAQAVYVLMPHTFSGRIAMTMGAKNMTMTEVQTGRRIGSCDFAGTWPK